RALGPQAADELESVVKDPDAYPSRRAKAVDGLTAAAPDRAARLVGALIRGEKQPPAVGGAAVHRAAEGPAPGDAQRGVERGPRWAGSAGMRRTAADVMSRTKGGCAAVRKQASRESAEHRAAWRDVLDRCAE